MDDRIHRHIQLALAVVVRLVCAVAAVVIASWAGDAEGALSVSLSPQIVEKTANPGRKVSDVISFTNASDDSLAVSIELADFTIDERGEVVEKPPGTEPTTLVPYLKLSPLRLEVAPGERVFFRYSIALPQQFDHLRTMIFFVSRPVRKQTGRAVTIVVPRLGIPLYVENRRAKVADVKVEEVVTERSTSDHSMVTVRVKMRNVGQRLIRPGGTIDVEAGPSFQFNVGSQPVLPGQTRVFTTPLQGVGGGDLSINVRLTSSVRGIFSGRYRIASSRPSA